METFEDLEKAKAEGGGKVTPITGWQYAFAMGGIGLMMYLIHKSGDEGDEGEGKEVSGGLEDFVPMNIVFQSEEEARVHARDATMDASSKGQNIDPVIQEMNDGTFRILLDDEQPFTKAPEGTEWGWNDPLVELAQKRAQELDIDADEYYVNEVAKYCRDKFHEGGGRTEPWPNETAWFEDCVDDGINVQESRKIKAAGSDAKDWDRALRREAKRAWIVEWGPDHGDEELYKYFTEAVVGRCRGQ